jgi:DNA-binding response OmpR family regulator
MKKLHDGGPRCCQTGAATSEVAHGEVGMRADGARMKLAAQDRAHRGPARVLLLERNAELREVLLWSFVEGGFVVVPCASLAELHRARRPGARDVAVVDCWSGPRPLPTDRERRNFARLGGTVPLVLLPN